MLYSRRQALSSFFSAAAFATAAPRRTLTETPPVPVLLPDGVSNAASALGGPVAPGELLSLSGAHLGPLNPAGFTVTSDGFVPTELGGVRAYFDDISAPLLYVSAAAVNTVVPYELADRPSATFTLDRDGDLTDPLTLYLAPSSPGLFTADFSGSGQCAALHADGSANGSANAARAGDLVSVYATGEGLTSPLPPTGSLAAEPYPAPRLPVVLSIGDQPAALEYLGAAPGYIAGLLKIDARIPPDLAPGPQPLTLQIGDAFSPPGPFLIIG